MRGMFASEVLRFRSRRLVWVLLILAVAAILVGVAIAGLQSTPPSGAGLAEAQAQADQEVAHCRSEGIGSIEGEELDRVCRANFGDPGQSLEPHMRLVELPSILEGISSIALTIGLLIGASLFGASWQTGTITTIFTWEPRRLRWFATRVAVIGSGVFVMTIALLGLLSGAMAAAASWRGSTLGTDGEWFGDVVWTGTRVAVIAAAVSIIGGAVAAISRHTAGALAGVFVYLAVLENVIRGFRPSVGEWLLGDNIAAFVTFDRLFYSDDSSVTPERALVVIALYVAVLLAAAMVLVRTRDVQ